MTNQEAEKAFMLEHIDSSRRRLAVLSAEGDYIVRRKCVATIALMEECEALLKDARTIEQIDLALMQIDDAIDEVLPLFSRGFMDA
jgi:hypothetical protein